MSKKIVVRCKTREEWKTVCAKEGDIALSSIYVEGNLINPKGRSSSHCEEEYFIAQGYDIITYQEYLKEGGDEVKFKVGDKVKILNGEDTDPPNVAWVNDMSQYVGKTDIIEEICSDGGIRLEDIKWYWDKSWLTLANEEIKTKTIKQEESEMNKSKSEVVINSVVVEVFGKDGATMLLVQKHFGSEIQDTFSGKLLASQNKDAFIGEAKKREKEELAQ
jgi:hypothetical protein